jgi:hypothetical protein
VYKGTWYNIAIDILALSGFVMELMITAAPMFKPEKRWWNYTAAGAMPLGAGTLYIKGCEEDMEEMDSYREVSIKQLTIKQLWGGLHTWIGSNFGISWKMQKTLITTGRQKSFLRRCGSSRRRMPRSLAII